MLSKLLFITLIIGAIHATEKRIGKSASTATKFSNINLAAATPATTTATTPATTSATTPATTPATNPATTSAECDGIPKPALNWTKKMFCFCKPGSHTNSIKTCTHNNLHCNTYDSDIDSCTKCNFWYWQQETHYEGTYCDLKWWLWVAFFGAALFFLIWVITLAMSCSQKKNYRELHGSELYLSGYEKTHGDYYD